MGPIAPIYPYLRQSAVNLRHSESIASPLDPKDQPIQFTCTCAPELMIPRLSESMSQFVSIVVVARLYGYGPCSEEQPLTSYACLATRFIGSF